jgi:hypothetical protein
MESPEIRQQIDKLISYKMGSAPFYSTGPKIKTDMDTFPYPRFYRGEVNNSSPVIFEREAGWHPRHDKCYNAPRIIENDSYPNHCFQAAPSTTYPCYPEYLRKYSDKREIDQQLFRKSVLEYR